MTNSRETLTDRLSWHKVTAAQAWLEAHPNVLPFVLKAASTSGRNGTSRGTVYEL